MSAGARLEGAVLCANDVISNPDLLLHQVDFTGMCCVFLEVSPDTYERSTFLDERTYTFGERLHGVDTNLVIRLLAQAPAPTKAPHFISHTSFCCSTLLARTLAFDTRSMVLREPQALVLLANAFRNESSRFPCRSRADYLTLVLRLLNKRYAQGQQVIIKPSNLANRLLPEWLRLVPQARGLVLTCELVEYLVSVLKKPSATQEKMPSVARCVASDSDYFQLLPELDAPTADPLRAAAIAWHAQRHFLGSMLTSYPNRCALLDQNQLLQHPEESVAAVCGLLELDASTDEIGDRVQGPLWRRDAKDPYLTFSRVNLRHQNQHIRQKHRARINETLAWMDPYLAQLPDGLSGVRRIIST